MEPRARAGKNVGKMNFSHHELAQLLYAHGDVRNPLPETVRVLDEIATEFIQGAAFEAARAASYAGRQKIKWEDFEFAFRKNPAYLGKVQEVFQKKGEIDSAKKIFTKDDEATLMKDAASGEDGQQRGGAGGAGGAGAGGREEGKNGPGPSSTSSQQGRAGPRLPQDEEELGEADDIDDAISEPVSRRGRG